MLWYSTLTPLRTVLASYADIESVEGERFCDRKTTKQIFTMLGINKNIVRSALEELRIRLGDLVVNLIAKKLTSDDPRVFVSAAAAIVVLGATKT